jgi:hypothetical protein
MFVAREKIARIRGALAGQKLQDAVQTQGTIENIPVRSSEKTARRSANIGCQVLEGGEPFALTEDELPQRLVHSFDPVLHRQKRRALQVGLASDVGREDGGGGAALERGDLVGAQLLRQRRLQYRVRAG